MIPYPYPTLGSLNLEQLLNAGEYYVSRWSQGLESNKAWRIVRYIIHRLWNQGSGQLERARFTCAQSGLSHKLGMSRRWVNALCQRIAGEDWLRYETTKLPDGTNSSCIWRIGGKLMRLLVTLRKSKQRKSPTNSTEKGISHQGPKERVRERNSSTAPPRSDGASRTEKRRQDGERGQERLEKQERDRALLLQPQVYSTDRALNDRLNQLRRKVAGQE